MRLCWLGSEVGLEVGSGCAAPALLVSDRLVVQGHAHLPPLVVITPPNLLHDQQLRVRVGVGVRVRVRVRVGVRVRVRVRVVR